MRERALRVHRQGVLTHTQTHTHTHTHREREREREREGESFEGCLLMMLIQPPLKQATRTLTTGTRIQTGLVDVVP